MCVNDVCPNAEAGNLHVATAKSQNTHSLCVCAPFSRVLSMNQRVHKTSSNRPPKNLQQRLSEHVRPNDMRELFTHTTFFVA